MGGASWICSQPGPLRLSLHFPPPAGPPPLAPRSTPPLLSTSLPQPNPHCSPHSGAPFPLRSDQWALPRPPASRPSVPPPQPPADTPPAAGLGGTRASDFFWVCSPPWASAPLPRPSLPGLLISAASRLLRSQRAWPHPALTPTSSWQGQEGVGATGGWGKVPSKVADGGRGSPGAQGPSGAYWGTPSSS